MFNLGTHNNHLVNWLQDVNWYNGRMRLTVVLTSVAFLVLLVTLGYLLFPRDPQGDFNPPGELVYSNGAIDSLDLLVMESFPPQFNAVVKGTLPDSCYEVYEINQQRVESRIIIDIRAVKPSDAVCEPIQKTFEELVSIHTDELTPGQYTVVAGSHQRTFEWPEVNQSL